MSTTDAPAKPRGFAAMTPEAREAARLKAAETRAANKATKSVAYDTAPAGKWTPTAEPSPDIAALLARIAKLEAEAAARAAPVADLPGVRVLPATRGVEAVYRYKPKGGWKAVATHGHPTLRSHADPRWEGELMEPPYNGNVSGALEVAWVTRVDGKIVETVDIQGGPCHMNEARSFLEKFQARLDAKSERPWDVEHFHRETEAAAKLAKEEGRVEDLRVIAEMLAKAMRGGPGSVREPVNV